MIRKINFFLIIIPAALGIIFLTNGAPHANASAISFDVQQKKVFLADNGISFEVFSNAATVQNFLDEQKIIINQNDIVFPEKGEKIYSGTHVIIWRAKKITIKEGGNTKQVYTTENTVQQALWENKDIDLGDDDITSPSRQTLLKDGMLISVTHVLIKEETKQTDINYKTVANEDDSLSWRVKKVTQPGVKGTRETKYKVVYYDGKEISRKILENNIIKNPTDEIVTQGTLVKTGKASTGGASWYAFKGGLFCANPWLPMGSYVRVTNQANGKSVIVKINDRGPFVAGRIVDLDKVAFAQIASLGAGVIDVKMEVVTN